MITHKVISVNANTTYVFNFGSEMGIREGVTKVHLSASSTLKPNASHKEALSIGASQYGGTVYEFPIIKGKAPQTIYIYNDTQNAVSVQIDVERLGGECCNNYFDKL